MDLGTPGGKAGSQVLRQLLQFVQGRSAGAVGRRETMLDVIMDQLALGVGEGVLNSVQLLGEVEARPALLKHRQNLAEMAVGALEALDDFGVAGVFQGRPSIDQAAG